MQKRKAWLNIIGLVLFVLFLPLFFRMGGGRFAMAEVLPGQAEGIRLSFDILPQEKAVL